MAQKRLIRTSVGEHAWKNLTLLPHERRALALVKEPLSENAARMLLSADDTLSMMLLRSWVKWEVAEVPFPEPQRELTAMERLQKKIEQQQKTTPETTPSSEEGALSTHSEISKSSEIFERVSGSPVALSEESSHRANPRADGEELLVSETASLEAIHPKPIRPENRQEEFQQEVQEEKQEESQRKQEGVVMVSDTIVFSGPTEEQLEVVDVLESSSFETRPEDAFFDRAQHQFVDQSADEKILDVVSSDDVLNEMSLGDADLSASALDDALDESSKPVFFPSFAVSENAASGSAVPESAVSEDAVSDDLFQVSKELASTLPSDLSGQAPDQNFQSFKKEDGLEEVVVVETMEMAHAIHLESAQESFGAPDSLEEDLLEESASGRVPPSDPLVFSEESPLLRDEEATPAFPTRSPPSSTFSPAHPSSLASKMAQWAENEVDQSLRVQEKTLTPTQPPSIEEKIPSKPTEDEIAESLERFMKIFGSSRPKQI